MAATVYLLGAMTALLCATLLLRAYGQTRRRLLLWSGLCFGGLTISNGLVFFDLILFPEINLYRLRLATAAISMLMLLYGLVWESDES